MYVIIWQDKIVSALCSSNYICCKIGRCEKIVFLRWSYFFLVFFVLFSWYFSHTHIHTSPMYLVCPFLFVCVSRASDKKRAAINICFYVRRQKLLRCVMSTFKYKLLGLRSHVNANLIAFTGILYFDFVWAWPCMCVCVCICFSSIHASIWAPYIKVHIGNCLSNE